MRTERSFSTPLLAGALLLAVALIVLGSVPLAACPRCQGHDFVALSPATGFPCSLCGGRKKVAWLKGYRWRAEMERRLGVR